MSEERNGKCLRQVEHIRGHLLTIPQRLSLLPVFSGIRVVRSSVFA